MARIKIKYLDDEDEVYSGGDYIDIVESLTLIDDDTKNLLRLQVGNDELYINKYAIKYIKVTKDYFDDSNIS